MRFVQLYNGGAFGSPRINWDAHEDLVDNHARQAAILDRPAAGLLQDLKRRGMLQDTLLLWTTEFGRTPITQGVGAKGRDHHPHVFTVWMAGGGLKPGFGYGASDEVGYYPANNPVQVYDLHATVLRLLGLDHKRLTFYHNGIRRRLTDVHGEVVEGNSWRELVSRYQADEPFQKLDASEDDRAPCQEVSASVIGYRRIRDHRDHDPADAPQAADQHVAPGGACGFRSAAVDVGALDLCLAVQEPFLTVCAANSYPVLGHRNSPSAQAGTYRRASVGGSAATWRPDCCVYRRLAAPGAPAPTAEWECLRRDSRAPRPARPPCTTSCHPRVSHSNYPLRFRQATGTGRCSADPLSPEREFEAPSLPSANPVVAGQPRPAFAGTGAAGFGICPKGLCIGAKGACIGKLDGICVRASG